MFAEKTLSNLLLYFVDLDFEVNLTNSSNFNVLVSGCLKILTLDELICESVDVSAFFGKTTEPLCDVMNECKICIMIGWHSRDVVSIAWFEVNAQFFSVMMNSKVG